MVLSVKDRVDIVKSAKHCAICLHPSHTTDKCFNKDKDNHICGVAGCTSHHHPVLHGSKDIYVTGVNTLLAQRLEALTTTGVPEFIPYDQWASRRQYSSDSYPADLDATVMLNANFGKSKREEEIEEVRAELAKPLIHGDRVLMCMSTVRVVYGQSGSTTSINSFFDDRSTCSAILNKVAERLQLWGTL